MGPSRHAGGHESSRAGERWLVKMFETDKDTRTSANRTHKLATARKCPAATCIVRKNVQRAHTARAAHSRPRLPKSVGSASKPPSKSRCCGSSAPTSTGTEIPNSRLSKRSARLTKPPCFTHCSCPEHRVRRRRCRRARCAPAAGRVRPSPTGARTPAPS